MTVPKVHVKIVALFRHILACLLVVRGHIEYRDSPRKYVVYYFIALIAGRYDLVAKVPSYLNPAYL